MRNIKKDLNTKKIFSYSVEEIGYDGGAFRVKPFKDSPNFQVIASFGMGWDHVSVSGRKRCPTWAEMTAIKDMFFSEDEWAVQYNPPSGDNIDIHPFCLHLWRPQNEEFPKPPVWMV